MHNPERLLLCQLRCSHNYISSAKERVTPHVIRAGAIRVRIRLLFGNQTPINYDVSAAALIQNVSRPFFYMQYPCVLVLWESN